MNLTETEQADLMECDLWGDVFAGVEQILDARLASAVGPLLAQIDRDKPFLTEQVIRAASIVRANLPGGQS